MEKLYDLWTKVEPANIQEGTLEETVISFRQEVLRIAHQQVVPDEQYERNLVAQARGILARFENYGQKMDQFIRKALDTNSDVSDVIPENVRLIWKNDKSALWSGILGFIDETHQHYFKDIN